MIDQDLLDPGSILVTMKHNCKYLKSTDNILYCTFLPHKNTYNFLIYIYIYSNLSYVLIIIVICIMVYKNISKYNTDFSGSILY